MITKIKSINNFAVFNGFLWDSSVVDSNNKPLNLDKINILYGRNYSGKTTLSRILRALETHTLPDKYENPQFEIVLSDSSEINQSSLDTHNLNVRVFNKDFVRDNLSFLNDPNGEIASFAILGADNVDIEKDIHELENTLGSNEVGKESGLYHQLAKANIEVTKVIAEYNTASKDLESKLADKATNQKIGIKYNPKKFGDQNYNIAKLKNEIEKVFSPKSTYTILTDINKAAYENIIQEQSKSRITQIPCPKLLFLEFCQQAEELLHRKIGTSSKIQELLLDVALNNWVKEGAKLLEGAKVCAFCGKHIDDERWQIIHAHFDEASKKMEEDIDSLVTRIEREKKSIINSFTVDKNHFYSKYHQNLDTLIESYKENVQQYINNLETIINQLKNRKDQITVSLDFITPKDNTNDLTNVFLEYSSICKENDDYSNELGSVQKTAQEALRLQEVYDFCITIGYTSLQEKISTFEKKKQNADSDCQKIKTRIEEVVRLIQEKRRLLNDEEEGARQVNKYLNDYFGHKFLTLQAIKVEEGDAHIQFQVVRDGQSAYNLSEGECSLIAFCYFIAKLGDVDTKSKKPIIWIDDPISSLDSNHIFFVYSLVLAEIVKKNSFLQLFISTHNLDFLKYMQRLNAMEIKPSGKEGSIEKRFFVINRYNESSIIEQMPKYLKDYATEYNYLFSKILYCSRIQKVDDNNYDLIINFSNIARKFLEVHLYFKYPDASDDKLQRFFLYDGIAVELINRLCNEGSHCSLEQAQKVDQMPEAILAAKKIIEKLKEDKDQYNALLKSIGE